MSVQTLKATMYFDLQGKYIKTEGDVSSILKGNSIEDTLIVAWTSNDDYDVVSSLPVCVDLKSAIGTLPSGLSVSLGTSFIGDTYTINYLQQQQRAKCRNRVSMINVSPRVIASTEELSTTITLQSGYYDSGLYANEPTMPTDPKNVSYTFKNITAPIYNPFILELTIVQKQFNQESGLRGYKYTLYKNNSLVREVTDTSIYPEILVDAFGVGRADKIKIVSGFLDYVKNMTSESGVISSVTPLDDYRWLSYNPDLVNSSISFNFESNSGDRREAYLSIDFSDGYSIIMQITQNGVDEDKPYLLFEKETYTVGADRYSINIPFIYTGSKSLQCSYTGNWIVNTDIRKENGYIAISYNENLDTVSRSSIITLKETGSSPLEASVTILQLSKDSPQTGIVDDDNLSGGYVAIDDNTGEDYSSDSLLYKQNSANIYNTLTSKDNTLFLGNYTNKNFSLMLYNRFPELFARGFEITEEIDTIENIQEVAASNYEYTPNMLLNSQQKKLFKVGEQYSLGIVCIHSSGTTSSVIPVGTYKPEVNPRYKKEGQSVSFTKPKAKITLTDSIVSNLKSLDVRAIIPVYACRNHHKVICQGFLNNTLSNSKRTNNENITSQYNWFQRMGLGGSTHGTRVFGELTSQAGSNKIEFQWNDNDEYNRWEFNNNILTLNTPEMELEQLYCPTDAELTNCSAIIVSKDSNSTITYQYHYQVNVNGAYLHSQAITPDSGWTTLDVGPRFPIWKGFLNDGKTDEQSTDFIKKTNETSNYKVFYVYPWQRDRIGGEGPESKIESKKFFKSLYLSNQNEYDPATLPSISKAASFRQRNNTTLLKYKDRLYQGIVDYTITPQNGYKALTTEGSFPQAYKDSKADSDTRTYYAGYDDNGDIKDTVTIRYNAAPHIVLFMEGEVRYPEAEILTVELQANTYNFETDQNTLESLDWIKCGNIVPLNSQAVNIYFEEGDYFYGRFDSLRVYPYSLDDTHSVTEIVSGMLCSRTNLDARYDRNRGVSSAIVTPQNFNLYNNVYSQLNNYFKYKYINLQDPIYQRSFKNSLQWSMGKSFGNEIDDWCNIQDSNTLDLDGDKGTLEALVRFDNNVYAFQHTGISQILYNDQMQIATTAGVPIEIANSGRVNGKRYLYENIGCQNYKAITSSLNGLYFIDSINKSIYKLGVKGDLQDLCTSAGMKSWGLSRLDKYWQLWYDLYTQEVLAVSDSECLAYHDLRERFQCFLNYEGIYNKVSLNGRVYMFKETVFENSNFINNTLWKKNDTDGVQFFGRNYPIGIELQINPDPTTDKTFTNLEYRADVISPQGIYQPLDTFDQLDVWNEYQYGHYDLKDDKDRPSNLKKKFRIWRANIPRAQYGITPIFLNNQEGWIKDITPQQVQIDLQVPERRITSRDRMRNPWLRLRLVKNNNPYKMIAHDFVIQYVE